jgi:DNA-binding response OmpR family regulator
MRITVLLLEDDRALAGVTSRYLLGCRPEWRLVHASSAGEASAHFERFRPAVVLVDLDLRLGSAVGWLETMRSAEGAVPWVGLTAGLTAEEQRALRALDPAAVLPKPFEPDRLLAAIESAVGTTRGSGVSEGRESGTGDGGVVEPAAGRAGAPARSRGGSRGGSGS